MNPVIKIDQQQINRLKAALESSGKNKLPRELSIAINRTSKFMIGRTAKTVVKGLRLKQKEVKTRLRVSQKARPQLLAGEVTLRGTSRLSLRRFAYNQTRKGVPYKIEKTGQRKVAVGAFMGPKPGLQAVKLRNGVWKRVGKKRKPITFLHGVSVVPFYKAHHLDNETHPEARKRLEYEINRRIRKALGGF